MNAQAAPFSGNEPGFMAQSESKCLHRTAPVPGGGMRRRGSLIFGISTGGADTHHRPGGIYGAGREQVLQPDGAGTRQQDASPGFMRFGNSK